MMLPGERLTVWHDCLLQADRTISRMKAGTSYAASELARHKGYEAYWRFKLAKERMRDVAFFYTGEDIHFCMPRYTRLGDV